MGCTSSKSFKGEGQRLGSGPTTPTAGPPNTDARRTTPNPPTTGQQAPKPTKKTSSPPDDSMRSAAARAAAQRADEQTRRGTNARNPNAGKLSDKLQEQNRKPTLPPESRRDERLTWD